MKILQEKDFSENNLHQYNKREIRLPLKAAIKIQNHHDSEIWIIRSGKGTLFTDNRCVEVKPGDVIVFSPFDYHYVTNSGPDYLVFDSEIIFTLKFIYNCLLE